MSLPWRLRWRLSLLWALQWGITGALLTYVSLYFEVNQLALADVGPVMAVGGVGMWVAPFVVGQICDRWMATERYLAIAHLIGGFTLLAIPLAVDVYRETQSNYNVILALFALYAAAYVPTIALATALTLRHLPNPKRQFGGVRVWGTIGWVIAGVGLSVWLERHSVHTWTVARYPDWRPTLEEMESFFHWLPAPDSRHAFHISAMLSFVLSTFCIFLPHTPPARTPRSQVAPVDVLRMFTRRSFVQLIFASSLLSLVIPLYNYVTPPLLTQLGFSRDWIPAVMTIGQISEPPALLLLSILLRRFGLKAVFGIGIAAWLLRYLIFALAAWLLAGPDKELAAESAWVLAGIALHGICHVFLIIVIQLFLDAECPADLRNSVQNLFAFLTLGVAMPIGMLLSQPLIRAATDPTTRTVDYTTVFLAASAVLAVLMLVFWRWFEPIDGRPRGAANE
jgi:MFS family permease